MEQASTPVAVEVQVSPTDPMEQTILATMSQQPADESASSERPRDPATGKFVKPENSESEPANTEAQTGEAVQEGAEAPAGEEEEEVVEIPEGYVAAKALDEDKAKEFKVRDSEGEIIAPDLTWEFTANGKPRSVTTESLIKYAQMGVYNHEREVAYEQQYQQSQELQGRLQEYEQAYQEQQQTIERLLSDPDYLVRTLQEYEQNNTPEVRAERQRQELERERQTIEMQRIAQQSETFVANTLEPALETIAQSLTTISKEELGARLVLAVDHYRNNGVLMPEGYEPAKRYIVSDLLPWAQQLHEHRMSERKAVEKETGKKLEVASKTLEKAQVKSQKVKRLVSAVTKPMGKAMPHTPPPKQVKSSKDAEDLVIGNALAAVNAA